MSRPICSNSVLKDFQKEFKDAFANYNSSVDAVVNRALFLDKIIFKMYDYISKVIPDRRCVANSDASNGFVSLSDYLALLDDLEHLYDEVNGVM